MTLKSAARGLTPQFLRQPLARAFRGVRGIAYSGGPFACACCGGHFRRFLPAPGGRPHAMCPRCGAMERHRLQWLFLQDQMGLRDRPMRMLQVAPDSAFEPNLRRMRSMTRIKADIASRVPEERIDITSIDHPDESFDCILCGHVLEHVPDDRRAMRELCRVLKSGGWALILSYVDNARETTFEDPSLTSPAERLRLFHQEDHVRVYGRDYADRLRQAGFEVEVVDYASELGPEAVVRYGLRDEDVYVCWKGPRPATGTRTAPRRRSARSA